MITTINNLLLFSQTIAFFSDTFKTFVIDGSKGIFSLNSIKFMFKKLRNQKLKWLVMADEDVIYVNPESVMNMIQSMEENNIDVCGVRDGGQLLWRNKNPNVLILFFCILNFEKIYSKKNFLYINA